MSYYTIDIQWMWFLVTGEVRDEQKLRIKKKILNFVRVTSAAREHVLKNNADIS